MVYSIGIISNISGSCSSMLVMIVIVSGCCICEFWLIVRVSGSKVRMVVMVDIRIGCVWCWLV